MNSKSTPSLIKSQSFEVVMSRLKQALGLQKDAELARALGLSTADFAHRKRRGKIPWDRVLEVASCHNISTDWLLTGSGPMYRRGLEELSEQERKLLELFEELTPEQRREILAAAEKAKQWLEMERRLQELERKVKKAG